MNGNFEALKDWKTTILGIALILLPQFTQSHWITPDWANTIHQIIIYLTGAVLMGVNTKPKSPKPPWMK